MSKDPDLIEVALSSSAIAFVSYHKKTGETTIEFVDGGKSIYKHIDQDTLEAFIAAPSAGAFFNNVIRGKFS